MYAVSQVIEFVILQLANKLDSTLQQLGRAPLPVLVQVG